VQRGFFLGRHSGYAAEKLLPLREVRLRQARGSLEAGIFE
jgi:hypothetical protein